MSFRERMKEFQNITLEFENKRTIKLDPVKYDEFCNMVCTPIEDKFKNKIIKKEFIYDSGFMKNYNYRYEIKHIYGVSVCSRKFNGLDYGINELYDAYGSTGDYGIQTCYLEDVHQITSRILRRLTDDFDKVRLSVSCYGKSRENINQDDIVLFLINTAQKYLTCPEPYIISSCKVGLNVTLYCTKTGNI